MITPMIVCGGPWVEHHQRHADGCGVILRDGDPLNVLQGISPECVALTRKRLDEQLGNCAVIMAGPGLLRTARLGKSIHFMAADGLINKTYCGLWVGTSWAIGSGSVTCAECRELREDEGMSA